MSWSDTLPGIAQAVVPGWFNTPPAAPHGTVTGWWAGLDIDNAIVVQFVTEAELRILKNMGAVLAVNVNRSVVLAAVRTMAFNRGLTVTMDLGLQGVFFLNADMPIGFNRAATLSKVWQVNFSQNITFNASMGLGKLMALGATNALWSVNRVAGLDHIVPVSGSATWNFGANATVLPIHTVNLAQAIGASLVADLTLIKFAVSYTDDFNRVNATTLGANWRVDRGGWQINTNHAQRTALASNTSRQGGWASYLGGANAGRMNTDKYGVTATFVGTSTAGAATDNCSGLVLAVGDTFGTGTMCYFVGFNSTGTGTTAGMKIMTQVGAPPTGGIAVGQTGQTQQNTNSAALTNGTVIEFRRDGNVFTVNRNGAFLFSWTDSGNIVSSGAANRKWGIINEGNFPLFQQMFYAPVIDTVTAADN